MRLIFLVFISPNIDCLALLFNLNRRGPDEANGVSPAYSGPARLRSRLKSAPASGPTSQSMPPQAPWQLKLRRLRKRRVCSEKRLVSAMARLLFVDDPSAYAENRSISTF